MKQPKEKKKTSSIHTFKYNPPMFLNNTNNNLSSLFLQITTTINLKFSFNHLDI